MSSQNYDPVEATQPHPPTSIRDSSKPTSASASTEAPPFISSSSNANTAARTDQITGSTPGERKGDVIQLDKPERRASNGEELREEDVLKEGGEDVGAQPAGPVQID